MAGLDGNVGDAVKSTANMTEQLRSQMKQSRQHPEKELGISAEDLQARKEEALKARSFTSDTTQRQFDVKSSARAQQIMNQGLEARQREKRQKDLRANMKVLRRFQYGLSAGCAVLMAWLGMEFIMPQYRAVQERNRILQIRYERAHASFEAARKTSEE